jgi:hypothetical protein
MNGFNYKTNDFNINNAYWLGVLANEVYDVNDENISEKLSKFGFSELKFFSKRSSQACICGNKSSLILSFRGTEGRLNDWLTDATVRHSKVWWTRSCWFLQCTSLYI